MSRLLPRSLRLRLILSHLFVAVVGVALIAVYAGKSIFEAARHQSAHNYEELAFALTNDLERPLADLLSGQGSAQEVEAVIQRYRTNLPWLQYTIYLPDGVALLSSQDPFPPRADANTQPEVFRALEDDLGEGDRFRTNAQGIETLYLAVRLRHAEQLLGALHLEISLEPVMTGARRSLILLVLGASLVAMGVSMIGYMLAGNISKPITSLTHISERLSKGDLQARAPVPEKPYELNQLTRAFNTMAGQLQSHLEELQSFVANASHELRTPLTAVKLRVEALRGGALEEPQVAMQFLAEIESEVDRLSHMVNDMLDLSRIEAGLDSSKHIPMDLAMAVYEVYETFTARAEKAGVSLHCQVAPGPSLIMGNEDQIRRMLYNLVDNAIKYTPHGGKVEMVLQSGPHGDTLCLAVKDTGFGIAPAHLPHVFERFYRVEATRPRYGPPQGSGLGLPIAKSIVEIHGGKISASSQLGVGTTFWVEFPVIA